MLDGRHLIFVTPPGRSQGIALTMMTSIEDIKWNGAEVIRVSGQDVVWRNQGALCKEVALNKSPVIAKIKGFINKWDLRLKA